MNHLILIHLIQTVNAMPWKPIGIARVSTTN